MVSELTLVCSGSLTESMPVSEAVCCLYSCDGDGNGHGIGGDDEVRVRFDVLFEAVYCRCSDADIHWVSYCGHYGSP